jgi:hypothetical protein
MPGECPVRVAYRNDAARCELELAPAQINDALIEALTGWLSDENVAIHYQWVPHEDFAAPG